MIHYVGAIINIKSPISKLQQIIFISIRISTIVVDNRPPQIDDINEQRRKSKRLFVELKLLNKNKSVVNE